MIEEIGSLLDAYSKWLRDKSQLKELESGYIEVTTPYLDRHNDYLQLYVQKEDEQYILTDAGEVITDLRLSGCELETPKRQALLKSTLNGFGVQIEDDILSIRADRENFPIKKHNLVQAMLATNDLFFLAAPTVASLFLEDVTSWLISNEIRFTPNVKFTGKTGYDHLFDFVIPSSNTAPERLLRAISRPDKNMAKALAFAWVDTREVRSPESRFYAFLNDGDRAVSGSVVNALRNYQIHPIRWSERDSAREELTQ